MTTAYTYIYDDNSHNPTPSFLEASRGRGKGGGMAQGPAWEARFTTRGQLVGREERKVPAKGSNARSESEGSNGKSHWGRERECTVGTRVGATVGRRGGGQREGVCGGGEAPQAILLPHEEHLKPKVDKLTFGTCLDMT